MIDAAEPGYDGPPPSRFSRRQALCRVGVAGLGIALGAADSRIIAAQDDQAKPFDALTAVELPPDLGQAEIQVYVNTTGHSLRGLFLDYWRANGAASVYGDPISEPFAATNGYYSQAFERGVFQYRPEFLHTADPIVRLMPLGRIALQKWLGGRGDEGQRDTAPRTDRSFAWDAFVPAPEAFAWLDDANSVSENDRDRTIPAAIRSWYIFNEGPAYFGNALGRPVVAGGTTGQWFEGGLVLASNGEVVLAPLAAALAPHLGIDMSPAPQGDLSLFDELLFWGIDNPNPRGDPYTPGAKWIEISIAEQRLRAYQGSTLISTTLVSTGLDPNLTERGMFRVRLKYPAQDMQGFTSATGEVTSVGDATPDPGTIPYAVAAVPNVLYFNLDAEALHGTYWHSNFGQKMSHGCVNLPLDFAAWLYGWAPLGTGVWVHD